MIRCAVSKSLESFMLATIVCYHISISVAIYQSTLDFAALGVQIRPCPCCCDRNGGRAASGGWAGGAGSFGPGRPVPVGKCLLPGDPGRRGQSESSRAV